MKKLLEYVLPLAAVLSIIPLFSLHLYTLFLEVVVDDVVQCGVVAAVHRSVHPVVNHIVGEVENAVPTDGRVPAGIARPQVAHERAVFAAKRASESVIVCIECLCRNRVLYSNVYSRKF